MGEKRMRVVAGRKYFGEEEEVGDLEKMRRERMVAEEQ
jgi:hypothetical protein